MKHFVKRMVLLVALCMVTKMVGFAQEPSVAELKFKEIVKRYENAKGVDCMTVVKGGGLEMVKLMFNKQFGKEFMKGVKSITIISYSEASAEVCQALRKEVDECQKYLTEFNLGDGKASSEQGNIRAFALPIDERSISDFVVSMEHESGKMIVYMAGEIKVPEQQKDSK